MTGRTMVRNVPTDAFHCYSLSGGKDSTAGLLLMLEKGLPLDQVRTCTKIIFTAIALIDDVV